MPIEIRGNNKFASSVTVGVSGTPSYIEFPTKTGNAVARVEVGGIVFNSTTDDIIIIGHNQSINGQVVANQPRFYQSMEYDYNNGTQHSVEWNCDFWSADNSINIRPLAFFLDRSVAALANSESYWQFVIGLTGQSQFSVFKATDTTRVSPLLNVNSSGDVVSGRALKPTPSASGVPGIATAGAYVQVSTNDPLHLAVNGSIRLTASNSIAGVYFAGDTTANLYWTSSGQLRMDGHLLVAGNFRSVGTLITSPSASQALLASTAISANAGVVQITTASNVTSTAAPTIADGTNGQMVTIINVGSNNLVLQDQGTLASSNLRLTATTVTLAPRQSIRLMFSSTVGDWIQVGSLVAVL